MDIIDLYTKKQINQKGKNQMTNTNQKTKTYYLNPDSTVAQLKSEPEIITPVAEIVEIQETEVELSAKNIWFYSLMLGNHWEGYGKERIYFEVSNYLDWYDPENRRDNPKFYLDSSGEFKSTLPSDEHEIMKNEIIAQIKETHSNNEEITELPTDINNVFPTLIKQGIELSKTERIPASVQSIFPDFIQYVIKNTKINSNENFTITYEIERKLHLIPFEFNKEAIEYGCLVVLQTCRNYLKHKRFDLAFKVMWNFAKNHEIKYGDRETKEATQAINIQDKKSEKAQIEDPKFEENKVYEAKDLDHDGNRGKITVTKIDNNRLLHCIDEDGKNYSHPILWTLRQGWYIKHKKYGVIEASKVTGGKIK